MRGEAISKAAFAANYAVAAWVSGQIGSQTNTLTAFTNMGQLGSLMLCRDCNTSSAIFVLLGLSGNRCLSSQTWKRQRKGEKKVSREVRAEMLFQRVDDQMGCANLIRVEVGRYRWPGHGAKEEVCVGDCKRHNGLRAPLRVNRLDVVHLPATL